MLYPVFGSMVVLINAILGLAVFFMNPQRRQNRLFALLCLSFVIWVFGGVMVSLSSDPGVALLWGRFYYSGVVFIAPLYLHFILSFEERVVPLHIYLPAFVFAGLSVFSGLFVSGLHASSGNLLYCAGCFDDVTLGPAYPFFAVYFLSFVLFGLYRSVVMYRYLSGIERRRMGLFVAGTAVPIIIGSVTNVIFLLIGLYGYGIADYLTVFMAFFIFRAFSIE